MALETHRSLHSALSSPVPGGLTTLLMSASGALPLCTLQSSPEVPRATTKHCSLESLSSFLFLASGPSGLYPQSASWLGSSRLSSLLGSHPGFGVGFSLRCSQFNPMACLLLYLSHLESDALIPWPDLTTAWWIWSPSLYGKEKSDKGPWLSLPLPLLFLLSHTVMESS